MSMQSQNHLSKARIRSVFLALLMVLSTTAALATTASASVARNYTTQRDPVEIAVGDFDCDGHDDLVAATEDSFTFTILYNDGLGNFNDRDDVWVSQNQSRNAGGADIPTLEKIEVGEFTGDSAIDIVVWEATRPGNLTIIENGGCGNRDWSIGQRYGHFLAWDIAVGDADQDGNDDIYVLELLADFTSQRVVVYKGPITSATTPVPISLGASTTHIYQHIEVGDYGETQTSITGGSCTDDDVFLLRGQGRDYTTNAVTNPGHNDNITVIEYDCQLQNYPASYSAGTNQANTHVYQMGTYYTRDISIADVSGNGYIDTLAVHDEASEDVLYKSASAQGVFGTTKTAYFGPYQSFQILATDLNGDGEPDFIVPTRLFRDVTTDSSGNEVAYLIYDRPTPIQVVLSDGTGGHVSPLSYQAGRRPTAIAVAQLQGGPSSALDIVVGQTDAGLSNWRDNLGWVGQYDTLTVIEMDNKDLAIDDFSIKPVDRTYGFVGEGTRTVNFTITNTGMDTLNGQTADLDVELRVVDAANSTNTTVYANDWDSPEDLTGCGSGCFWTFEEYIDDATSWHLETNHSVGASSGNNQPSYSANYLNPTDFMWAGDMQTNSSGDEWSGYSNNMDDAMVLNNVDLTGADRAFMSVELFRHLGVGGLQGSNTQNGLLVTNVMDDLAFVEVGSAETGWGLISCPILGQLFGDCPSGKSIWGGYDTDREYKQDRYGASPENLVYYGLAGSGTYQGWDNFTEEDLGAFDLSDWAGEVVDIRFRFRTGYFGSTSDADDSQWSGRDGFAVDNLTIWKQNTAFRPNPQIVSTTIGPLNNFQPGQQINSSIQADFLNDTIYRISAVMSNNAWDEQTINNDFVGYERPRNFYDPTVETIENFSAGRLYAQGFYDIAVVTNNYGNTAVDYDVKATVYSATPSDVYCGTPKAVCLETFEGGQDGYRYEENQQAKGAIYGEDTCTDKIFNNFAYWFGHPCDTGTYGYEDAWVNQTLKIPNIDLTNLSGDYVSLDFEYYADTYWQPDIISGDIDPSDYVSMQVDYNKDGANYTGLVIAQWNDYNEDGTCRLDDNDDGIANSSESFDFDELTEIGDPNNIDGEDNWNVFFNTDELVKTTSIDLTHLYIQNRSSSDTSQWNRECLSLNGSVVDINFEFLSDEDGRNGKNDGFKGIGFNNITLREFTFVQDAVYTDSLFNIDAEQPTATLLANHEFLAGVYRIDVRTVLDNTDSTKPWYNTNELSTSNNVKRVIFTVESVDIKIGKPNVLSCYEDQNLPCVFPIDGAFTHNWDIQVTNGVLAGDYKFFMEVTDTTDGSQVYITDAGSAVGLEPQQRTSASFILPVDTVEDGGTYNISFYGQLADGTATGNVRSFIATFAEHIDVAILSDSTTRTTAIKQDLAILGMSYTQFEINDWNTYFEGGWFTHYDKIVLPWQEVLAAKDTQFGGDGYYQYLGEPARRSILENFMNAGGTVQAHLGPLGSQIYGLDQGLSGRLPFGLDIQSRDTASTQVTFNTMDLADPFHPIMDNVNTNAFQGFDANSGVAQAVLNTKSVSSSNVPGACNSYMENGGYFQRLIRSTEDIQDTVLGVCSYASGGLIVSTIDLATHSERANSTTFPLLGNVLKHKVTPYPEGFGTLGNGLDLTINTKVPEKDPSTNAYELRHIKSDATLDFGFITDTETALHADWVIDGPTNWDGSSLANGVTGHSTETSPSMTFCKADLASQTGCAQGEQWVITLMLHTDDGHARTIDITVETNDIEADEFRPEANAVIDIRTDYEDDVEFIGTKTVANAEWDVHRIILQGEGDEAELVIHFDASGSQDEDALEGNGIESYEWKVLFDAPYGDNSFDLDGHEFTQTAASDGAWSYKFKNVTVDSTGTTESQIRIELVVYDSSGKFSEKHRMYFVVVPEGFGDEPPELQWNNVALNNTRFTDDNITISGQILSGSEKGEVFVEAAFSQDDLAESSLVKYQLELQNLWAKSENLSDGDNFELTLDMSSFYTNQSTRQSVYIKYYEGTYPNERWVTIKWIELDLPACQGLEVNPDAEAAGGEFVLDANGDCQWSGAWSYDPTTGEWTDNSQSTDGGDGTAGGIDTMMLIIGGAVLLLIVFGTLMFVRRGGDDEDDFTGMGGGFGANALDPTEQYVQQLIAQGYPEETARSFAAQYVGGAAAQPAAQAAAQPAAQPAAGYDQAIYDQYYQQFVSQGYDAATAAAYAQQYAVQYAQSQQ